MKPVAQSDAVLVEHMLECIARIREYTDGKRPLFSLPASCRMQ